MNYLVRRLSTAVWRDGGIRILSALTFILGAVISMRASDTAPDTYSEFNEDYYKQFFYEWVDDTGAVRRSSLVEPATEYNQIVAMLREVYTNPQVPGFVVDQAWEEVKDQFNITDPETNTYYNVPYAPCLATGNPYGMDNTTVVPTPIAGATALLVELKDDYAKTEGAEAQLRQIKSITLLTHQRYVSDAVSTDNPGYLFNYVGTLNNFFVITKGKNRIAINSEEVDGVLQGHAPFYHMYEEFSPSNEKPIYNAYAEMNGGHAFGVDHNCTSIMGQDHIIVMSPRPAEDSNGNPVIDPEVYHDYPVNFMFFLPDKRFYCDSRLKPNSNEKYGWYTYYSQDHMPYFFFNKIKAKIPARPVSVENIEFADGTHKAKVLLHWKSEYNGIVGYSANEDFYIFRVVNDVIDPTPLTPLTMNEDGKWSGDFEYIFNRSEIAGDESDIDPDEVNFNDDNSITSKTANNLIYIYETSERFSRDVSYVVMGRRYLTDFELTESNIVETSIPGRIDPPDPKAINIVIDGQRTSTYDMASAENHYTHVVYMFDSGNTDTSLKGCHLDASNEEGVETGTRFKLMRGEYNADGTLVGTTLVATYTITEKTQDRWNQFLYAYTITDAEGNTVEYTDMPQLNNKLAEVLNNQLGGFKNLFKTPYGDGGVPANGDDDINVVAPDPNYFTVDGVKVPVILAYVDKFDVSTRYGDHPSEYRYYIDYEGAKFTDPDRKSDYENTAASNTVAFPVPHNTLKAGYIPYSEAQILADEQYNTRVAVNNPGLQFSITTNPNVDTYTIYSRTDGTTAGKAVMRATRMPTGRLAINRINKAQTLSSFKSVYKVDAPAVEMLAGTIEAGDEFHLVVKYANGNSYGNTITYLRPVPAPQIAFTYLEPVKRTSTDDPWTYNAHVSWYATGFEEDRPAVFSADTEELEADQVTHRGYRAWGKHNAANVTDFDIYHNSVGTGSTEEDSEEATPLSLRDATSHSAGINHVHTIEAHEATTDNPVNFETTVRLYSALPKSMTISENSDPGFVVADAHDRTSISTYYPDNTAIDQITGDAGFDPNAPVEYFNLQGMSISDPEPGSIVIRRQGSSVAKVFIP